jgi:hypothetical protein
MAGKRFDVVRKDESNPEKVRWQRVGVVFMNEEGGKDGGTLKLDMFGDKYYLFAPKDDQPKGKGGDW